MLARPEWTPYSTKSERKAARRAKRLNSAKRQALIDKVVAIMRIAGPTPFAAESTCRHAIRAALCLQGWSWRGTEDVARETVRAALDAVGAKRPAWKEGQPEYTQEGYSPIERTRCVRCGWKLPEGHSKFCGAVCARAAHNDTYARDRREQLAAYARAYRAAQR